MRDKGLACIVGHYEKRGSIKDLLWQATPTDSYFKKYLNKKGPKALDTMVVRVYARQILEALSFLHKKGFPYGHLHSRNVLVDNRKCRLTNLENVFLGLPPYHRYRLLEWKRCTTVFEADVVMFGALLYEMTTGEELPETGMPRTTPETMSERIKEVIAGIFNKDQPLPTVADLLQVPYFASVDMEQITGEFKRTTKIKEVLDAVAEEYKRSLKAAAMVARGVVPAPELRKRPSVTNVSAVPRSRQAINTRLSEAKLDDGESSAGPSPTPMQPTVVSTPAAPRPAAAPAAPAA
eukprot:Unigene7574_Nuclearia_a/m.23315 Unigene7574_Nuclearia_a/g.23315  ORF Unigene7574_Nuclearia_a/g.23315 Unigene7574_Nuclearia_a/m.23315 type:complete len:293 (+) Unigene7574_Nuclearia_a:200-1078(+)